MAERKKPTGRGKGPVQGQGPWSRTRALDEVPDVRRPKKEDEKKVFSLEDEKDAFPPLPKSGTCSGSPSNTCDEEKKSDDTRKDKNSNIPNIENKGTELNKNEEDELNYHTMNLSLNKDYSLSDNKAINNKRPTKEPVYITRQKMFNLVPQAPPAQEVPAPAPALAAALALAPTSDPNVTPPVLGEEPPAIVSTLSPLAQEFVPRSQQNNAMNPSATTFVPADNLSESLQQNWSESRSQNTIEDVEDTINFFYQKINESPGLFDQLMHIIVPTLSNYLKSTQLVIKIVNDLYDLCINDYTFAYHAVKMLVYMVKVSTTDFESTEIRDRLLTLAQTESESTLLKLEGYEIDLNSIIPFLFFLSELYIQLEANGRLFLIGQMVVTILKKLLSVSHLPIKDRLNTAVSIVKLTGIYLDEDDTSALDSIIKDMQELLNVERSNLDTHTIGFVENLIHLRSSQWGLSQLENKDELESALQTSYEMNETLPMVDEAQAVFYGPDGQIIPYEEQMFLEGQVLGSAISSVEDPSEHSRSSMDGEMEDAYNEFLQTIPQAPQPMPMPMPMHMPMHMPMPMPMPMPIPLPVDDNTENDVPELVDCPDLAVMQDPPPQQ